MRLLCCLVVDVADGLFELGDLLLKYLLSHSVSDTIAIDNEVLWQLMRGVSFHKCVHGLS